MTDEPWYKKGLKFKCTECGQCCTGSPGTVWVDENEIQKMSEFLKITPVEFVKKYTRLIGSRLSLKERLGVKPGDYDCVFLKDRRCQVYGSRPKQCRTFPWWPDNLNSKKDWNEVAKLCEGINHKDAPLISLETIQKAMNEPSEL